MCRAWFVASIPTPGDRVAHRRDRGGAITTDDKPLNPKQEESLRFALQMLGAELVDEAPPGSYVAHIQALRRALERGDLTEEEYKAAFRRAFDRSMAGARRG